VEQLPLVLGEHSFIAQLGNDPAATEAAQVAIFEDCLDNGIKSLWKGVL
jgi:hypothetical protein